MALRLLRSQFETPCRVRIIGDNLPVIRYCAGTARLRRPGLHRILDEELALVAGAGWHIEWVAVWRRFNARADEAATDGCRRAAALAGRDHTWHEELTAQL